MVKTFLVRLKDYNGNIIDGEFYNALSAQEAEEKYLNRCKRLGIDICKYDYITVEECEL